MRLPINLTWKISSSVDPIDEDEEDNEDEEEEEEEEEEGETFEGEDAKPLSRKTLVNGRENQMGEEI